MTKGGVWWRFLARTCQVPHSGIAKTSYTAMTTSWTWCGLRVRPLWHVAYPLQKREDRTAEGSPGWDGGRSTLDAGAGGSAITPLGPLKRAAPREDPHRRSDGHSIT